MKVFHYLGTLFVQEYISTIVFLFFFCWYNVFFLCVFYDTSDHILPAVLYSFFFPPPSIPPGPLTAREQHFTDNYSSWEPKPRPYTLLPQVGVSRGCGGRGKAALKRRLLLSIAFQIASYENRAKKKKKEEEQVLNSGEVEPLLRRSKGMQLQTLCVVSSSTVLDFFRPLPPPQPPTSSRLSFLSNFFFPLNSSLYWTDSDSLDKTNKQTKTPPHHFLSD